jgi:DNA polymerase
MIATIDFETKSYADLKQVGAWAYSEDLTTDVICMAWGVGHEPIKTWVPARDGWACPDFVRSHLDGGGLLECHNAAFEKSIWQNVLVRRYEWPCVPSERWRDTMAVAAYYALPLALDRLAYALGYEGKAPEGGRLITKYSKLHLKTAKPVIPADDLASFVEYCVRDVMIEQSVSDVLGELPERELDIYLSHERMNERGLLLDLEGIAKAEQIVDMEADRLTQEYRQLVGVNPTQRDKSMAWFAANGLELPDMQADTLEELLDDLPSGDVRRAIEIRLAINKASTKKLGAMARNAGLDGRARFQTRYHGAVTGRPTGTGFQPLNLNRGFSDVDPDDLVSDIMFGDARWLDALYGNATDAVAKASRHWILAAPGHELIAADFVSVEAVVLACLAGEQWKIDAFARKEPIYERTADKIYNLPAGTVTKKTHPTERQDGKTCELAFGYQGALGAWLKFDDSGRHTDEAILGFCKAWRQAHPATVNLWRGLETAALEAMQKPYYGATPTRVAGTSVAFEVIPRQDFEWLTMILPNGKHLWYYKPEVRLGWPHWHKPATDEECAAGTCNHTQVPKLTYMSMKEGQWKRVTTYGGKLTENLVQATSRELMEFSKMNAEKAGYQPILTVYDELLTEQPIGQGSADHLKSVLEELPSWASGWPISADPWSGGRYRK